MFCILDSKCHSYPNPTVHCTKVVVNIDCESAQGCRAVDSLQRSLLNSTLSWERYFQHGVVLRKEHLSKPAMDCNATSGCKHLTVRVTRVDHKLAAAERAEGEIFNCSPDIGLKRQRSGRPPRGICTFLELP